MHIDHDDLTLVTESDVEQKVVMPLLTGAAYLEIPPERVYTKEYLAPTALDKTAGRTKGYYPDYTVWMKGFPVLVVEAKAPEIPPEVGYREAGLYARHLNQQYPTGINPCIFLMSTNGRDVLVGHWDCKPEIEISVADLRPGSAGLERLREHCGTLALTTHAADCLGRVRARRTFFPYDFAGGSALLRARLPVNAFAADLSPILRRYFSSSSDEGNREIIQRGYVTSAEVTVDCRIR
jgi:hypothetical protein